MATYLYRLGRFSARRAWPVVITWLLLLGVLGGLAGTLGKPFSSRLTIPGTEFQRVLDDLQTSLPKAAGGIGTVVFRTSDGKPFTDAQRAAITALTQKWTDVEGVDQALDPFATQKQLDDAAAKVRDGQAQLAEGRQKLAEAEGKLTDGQQKAQQGETDLAAAAAKIADGERQLAAAEAQLADGQRQYDAGAAKLADGKRQIAAAQQQLDAGRTQIEQAQAQIDSGTAQLAAAQAQVDAGRQQLTGLQAQVDQLTQLYGPSDPRTVAAAQQLATQTATLNATQQQLDAQRAQLVAGQQQLDPKKAELAAGQSQLDAKKAELAAGERQLAASKARLDSGRATLAQKRAELEAGKAQLADGQARLAQGKTDAATGAQQIAEGKAKLTESEAALARGQRQLALSQGMRMVSERGDVAVSQILFEQQMSSVPMSTRQALPAVATSLEGTGVTVDYSKEIVQDLNLVDPGELLGILVAGIVLLVMLGSLLAAGLPLLSALVGVGVGLLGTIAATSLIEMADITPALALMLGLAVGIDYSLFLINRHREQLAGGMELQESIGVATGTAGNAVLFGGLTVIVALAALTLTGIPFLGVMGIVAAITVAVAVLVALTLTPALLRLMGEKVLSRKARARLQAKLAAEESEADEQDLHERKAARHQGRGRGWGGLVTRHPIVTMLVTTAVLVLLALPAMGLKLGLPDASYEPAASTAYRTYHAVETSFGPGRNGPIIAVATVEKNATVGLTDDGLTDLQLAIGEEFKRTPGIAYVLPVGASADRRTLAFQLVPTSGPSDDATKTLVTTLRSTSGGIVERTPAESIGFSGQTVANIDISQILADVLPRYLLVVVGISLLLLLLVFRSVVVPVLATAGFLLSIAAAFGGVVAVYQWGWLGPIFGVERPGLVLSFLPILVIGILFGLAMDYQMFLVSGMREAWAHGHTARTAVRTGFSHGARVVTAAALIMFSVFASFIHAHLTMVRPLGFALAFGVLIDAFIVRMTAMPAIMHLLGEKAWYLPRWLDRILPDLDVEGTKLAAARQAAQAPPATQGERELAAARG